MGQRKYNLVNAILGKGILYPPFHGKNRLGENVQLLASACKTAHFFLGYKGKHDTSGTSTHSYCSTEHSAVCVVWQIIRSGLEDQQLSSRKCKYVLSVFCHRLPSCDRADTQNAVPASVLHELAQTKQIPSSCQRAPPQRSSRSHH